MTKWGKNLIPPETFDVSTWTQSSTNPGVKRSKYWELPPGTYTCSLKPTEERDHYGYLYIETSSTSDFSSESKRTQQWVQSAIRSPFTITVGEGESYIRLWWYHDTNKNPFIWFKDIQIELGAEATSYEAPIAPVTYKPNTDGSVGGVVSIYPHMTLMTNQSDAVVTCEYNRDTNKVIEKLTNAIISLGGNV